MLKSIFKWQNQDSTLDLNTRLSSICVKGFISGGLISTVVGQLKIQIQPLTAMSNDGMLVVDENPGTAGLLSIPLGQTSAVALQAKYNLGADPTLGYIVQEISAFNNRIDRNDFILLAQVTPTGLVEVDGSDINYSNRETLDKLARSPFRGTIPSLSSTSLLPVPPSKDTTYIMVVPPTPALPVLYVWLGSTFGWQQEDTSKFKLGDFFMVIEGAGALPSLLSWDGLEWLNITFAQILASELAQHRANLYPNEKHLTDNQADAALGSVGPVSITNRYVTENDPRLPAQNENDALVGSDGTPSSTNKYVTQEYFIAQPTTLFFGTSPGAAVEIGSGNGPVFVGNGPAGSANNFFSFLNYSSEDGYINSQGYAPKVTGVYKDILLTTPLVPSSDADSSGFYSSSLYLAVDVAIDTSLRVIYGKKVFLKNLDKGFALQPSPSSEYVASKAVEAIQNIKGRPYNIFLPNREQNKALRSALDGVAGYLGSALQSNLVADKKDFERLQFDTRLRPEAIGNYSRVSNVVTVYSPDHGLINNAEITVNASTGTPTITLGDKIVTVLDSDTLTFIDSGSDSVGTITYTFALFVYNVGIEPVYRYSNISLHGFTYSASLGRITYSGAADLSQCVPGNLFQDSGANKFLITGVVNGGINPYITIVSTETGDTPPVTAVNVATPAKLQDGSIIVNNNSRNCLLSEFKFGYGSDVIPVNYVYPLNDEFEKPTGQISFGIKQEDGTTDPRVVLYGGWQNFPGENEKKSYVRNKGAYGKIVITGFFTDVLLWMRRTDATPNLLVQLNQQAPVIVSTSQSKLPGKDPHKKFTKLNVLKIPSGYDLLNSPNTCTISIQAPTADSLEICAIELCRSSIDSYKARSNALVESGRAFDLTKIVSSDNIQENIEITGGLSTVPARGHRKIVSVSDNSTSPIIDVSSLVDIDTGLAGTVMTSSKLTNVSGVGVSAARVNDLIIVSNEQSWDTYYASGDLIAGLTTITIVGTPLDAAVGSGWVIEGDGIDVNTQVVTNSLTSITIDKPALSTTFSDFRFYKSGDAQIVKIQSIASLGSNLYEWELTPTLNPASFPLTSDVYILHLCSTDLTQPNVGEESQISRFSLTKDFINGFDGDFELEDTSNRFIVGPDGTTVIAGENLSVVTSGITGTTRAVKIESTGELRIAALCTRFDLVVANSTAANPVQVSIDGSDYINFDFSDNSSYRRTLFFNARYQTHEIKIKDPAGSLCVSEVIIFGPAKPALTDFPVELADMCGLAKYIQSSTYQIINSNSRYPVGAVFLEATTYCAYLDNSSLPTQDWVVSPAYSAGILRNPYGPYIHSSEVDASVEFYFVGDTFEIQFITGPDHGNFKIYVDGDEITDPSKYSIIGDYSPGYVDGYKSGSYGRKNVGVKIKYPADEQEFFVHQISVVVLGTKNIASSGFKVALSGVWLASSWGAYYCTNQQKGLFSSAKDLRKFLAIAANSKDGDISPPIVADNRAGSVACAASLMSITVTYTNPLPDENYILMLNFSNTVDAYPLLQNAFITNKTPTGFTAAWNAPLDTANYRLNYFVAPFK
jgi:hypothetical protein